jgi:hypothetical protein
MVNIVPLDKERHAGKGWVRPVGYNFAAGDTLVPLSASEFALAVPAMPIGFIERGGHYAPVALMGLTKEANVFVGPAGQWLGGYVPAVLRSYPFSLRRVEAQEQPIVCIDEDSGLVVEETAPNAEKFFDAAGNPAPTMNWVAELLHRIEQDQTATDLAVAALAEARLIKPWALTVPMGKQQVTVNGLHQVDEAALNRLDDASFLKLRKTSGLPVAYAQLLSTGQINVLARLNLIQQQLLQSGRAGAELPVTQ